ncbi:MAG TPA: hypothetical protein VI756_03055 [Blastocatellia bacterium]
MTRPSGSAKQKMVVPVRALKNISADNDLLIAAGPPGASGVVLIVSAMGSVARLSSLDHVNAVLGQVSELLKEEDIDGYVFKPTSHALATVKSILNRAYYSLVPVPPDPFISPDGMGGVRIEWNKGTRIVSLMVPATQDEPPYVYHRDGDDHSADLDMRRVSAWLKWLR